MLLIHDPVCAEYGSSARPEQPARVLKTAAHLQAKHAAWAWQKVEIADEATLLVAHAPELLARLRHEEDFDDDTPYFAGIYEHARRSVGSALAAAEAALKDREHAFSLMRPPGHHATREHAMGFCYLNQIAIAALAMRRRGVERVAIWDFDAHHGNGTEAIVHGEPGVLFASVHQFPGYPGTGTQHFDNCRNYPVRPHAPREEHLRALHESWDDVLAFKPNLILVSAGFDAYRDDPITDMSLEHADFAELGRWLAGAPVPCAAILEGGYSAELPALVDSFLTAWDDPFLLGKLH